MNAEKIIIIESEHGLHTRPAARFAQAAKEFESTISLIKMDNEQEIKSANAKSLFKLQTLGITSGTKVKIRAEGPDAEKAVETLSILLDQLAAAEQTNE